MTIVSMSAMTKQLTKLKTGHTLQQENLRANAGGDASSPSAHMRLVFTLFIQLGKLLKAADAKAIALPQQNLRLNVLQFSLKTRLVSYLVRGRLNDTKDPESKRMLSAVQDEDVEVKPDGQFLLKLQAPFGESCEEPLVHRMMSLQRVRSLVAALTKLRITIKTVNLKRIVFAYPPTRKPASTSDHQPQPSTSPSLKAKISFPSTTTTAGSTTPHIILTFPSSNPHHRIESLLSQQLNLDNEGKTETLFSSFLDYLRITLPLLRAFDAIEARESAGSPSLPAAGVTIHCRTLDTYRIQYRQRGLTLAVHIRRFRDVLSWVIEELPSGRTNQHQQQQQRVEKSAELNDALRKAWRQRGDGWRGLSSCIKADIYTGGVLDALLTLDGIIRNEKVEGDVTGPGVGAGAVAGSAGGNQGLAAPAAPTATMAPAQNQPEVITLD